MRKKTQPIQHKKHELQQIISGYSSWWFVLCIVVLTILFYLPVLYTGFVNWDDADSVIENLHIRFLNLSSIRWMFTAFHTGNWIPLTWLSFALDYQIAGLNSFVYHLHNLLLHAINTILVFFLSLKILRLGGFQNSQNRWIGNIPLETWIAFLTALLFGLHPVHVESVAWVTERKDLLCGIFFFASLLVYLDDASSDKRDPIKRWICLGLFALSLLAKPMSITLPLVLLLLDGWPLKKLNSHFFQCVVDKIPFFLLSIVFVGITIAAQASAGAILAMTALRLDFRIMNAFHSLWFYIWKMLLPVDLVPFYPMTHQGLAALSIPNLTAFAIVVISGVFCFSYRKKRPYLFIGFLYYLITLLPVLGILQVGGQAAADRYMYIPSVSLLLLFSAAFFSFLYNRRTLLAGLSVGLVVVLGCLTTQQIAIWKNSVTLWERVVDYYPDLSIVVHTNMANAYKQFGRNEDALGEYDRAIALKQPHPYVYDGKGMVLLDLGRVDQAIDAFHQSIALDPDYASPHRNLWFAYDKKGLHDLALTEILEALKINPEFTAAYNNLGISLGRQSKFEESIKAFNMALSFDPYNSMYLINLATTYQRYGYLDEAINWYKRGLKLNANEPVYFLNLANVYSLKGMLEEAIETLQKGAQLSSAGAEIFQKLGTIYEKLGEQELAIQNYEKALRLKEVKP